MLKETPGTVSFVDNNTTRKAEIMRSNGWIRPLASSSAVLAGIGALIVAVPLTAPGTGIARAVTSPAYELVSHNANEADANHEVPTNATHVEDVHTNATHVEDVHTNATHVEDVHTNATHVDGITAISGSSSGKFTGYVAESRTQNQTPAQPRVTVSSAKPAKSAAKESSKSVKRAPESVSVQSNGTSTRSNARSTRTSAAHS